jgi:prophage tail gpP-like protein
MELEVESDAAGFVGVLITKNPDGTILLTQTGLIQRILAALNMVDFNTK